MLRAQRRNNKYQLHSFWFDPIGARTHDLSSPRQARANPYITNVVIINEKLIRKCVILPGSLLVILYNEIIVFEVVLLTKIKV